MTAPLLSSAEARRFDSFRLGLYCYSLLGIFQIIGAAMGATIRGVAFGDFDAAVGLLIVLGAVAALRRRRIGYCITFSFSVFFLMGIPIGTVLGWAMIRTLRRVRHLYVHW